MKWESKACEACIGLPLWAAAIGELWPGDDASWVSGTEFPWLLPKALGALYVLGDTHLFDEGFTGVV